MSRGLKITVAVVSVVIVIAAAGSYWLTRDNSTLPRTATAEKRDVIQDVVFTGRLVSKQKADLSFEVSGTVTERLVAVGDTVEAGQPIARLDTIVYQLEAAGARATQAATEEETRRAWQKAIEEQRNIAAENAALIEKKKQAVRDAKAELDEDRDLFDHTAQESGDESSTTDTAHGLLIAAESKWNAAQDDLAQTLKTVDKTNQAAKDAASVAEAQYLATTQVAPGVAGLSTLEASAALARHRVFQGLLNAPFGGIITALPPEVGEYLVAGTTAATLETTADIHLTADVPETDAIKVTERLPATITFDAFSLTEQWPAHVTEVAPTAVMIEGVPTYEINLDLEQPDQRLRPGLTANITIHADSRKGVIAVPRRAVVIRGTEQFVRILHDDGAITEQVVTTGLVGSDGAIEITSGLSEGQRAVTSTLAEE